MTSAALTTLSSQVTALTDLVTRLLPARVGEANPTPPAAPLVAPLPVAPTDQPLDLDGSRLCLCPTPMPGSLTDAAGSWDSASYFLSTKLPVSGLMEPVWR